MHYVCVYMRIKYAMDKMRRVYQKAGACDSGNRGSDGGTRECKVAQVPHKHEGDELDAKLKKVDDNHWSCKP